MRHGHLLHRRVGASSGVGAAVHSNVLLSSRVDPCGGSGVVVHKVGTSLRREPLLPADGELAQSGRGGSRHGHGHRVGCRTGSATWRSGCNTAGGCASSHGSRGACSGSGAGSVVRTESGRLGSLFGQRSVLMPLPLQVSVVLSGLSRLGLVLRVGRTGPCGAAVVVVHVVGSAQIIGSSFPAGGQSAKLVLE